MRIKNIGVEKMHGLPMTSSWLWQTVSVSGLIKELIVGNSLRDLFGILKDYIPKIIQKN